MRKVMQVSSSGYYDWQNRSGDIEKIKAQEELLKKIRDSYEASDSTYGSPRITRDLQRQGILISRPRIARIMKKDGIRSIIGKKWKVSTTDPDHNFPVCDNILNRDFHADQIGTKWVSDITYLRTGEGWLYLTTVMDLAGRKIIGWPLSEGMSAEKTTLAALGIALKNRKAESGLIFHSDRGVQYACNAFKDKIKSLKPGFVQSMSRKGKFWDNAATESFFRTAKSEKFNRYNFKTRQGARLCVFRYIEGWYNKDRLHSTIGYKAPNELAKEIEIAA